jgi:site-specific DNA-methyltransferase (adenine-specific)
MFENRVNILNDDCCNVMRLMKENNIFVDLTVTSPPYDDLRTYNNSSSWDFNKFKEVAKLLYDITAEGGVVVWVVGDAVIKGSESGSSFRQALYFMECGFKLHDTMIYEKNGAAFPARRGSKRYTQIFEYMFVFVKGKIHDCNLLCDKPNKWAGHTNWGKKTHYNKEGELKQTEKIKPIQDFSMRNNIWKYSTGFNEKTGHPAVYPQQLATDHILSWSLENQIVFDPFLGSGTTALSAIRENRKFIGCEIDETYFNICSERIEKELNMKN